MFKTIKREEIQSNLKGGVPMILVEALPEKHYADQHLPGALNINHDEVEQKATQLLPDNDALIVVYCSNVACKNSGIAAQKLSSLGYSKIFKYAEGKQDWIEAGLPTEGVKTALSA